MGYFSHSKNKVRETKSLNQKGFTITEVVIVLAIVGAIIAVVLLAVPRLQRMGRNSQRNADIQTIIQAINDYAASHTSALPDRDDITNSTNHFEYVDFDLSIYEDTEFNNYPASGVPSNADESYYDAASGGGATKPAGDGPKTTAGELPDEDNIHIWIGYKCVDNDSEAIEAATAGQYNTANFESTSRRAYTVVYMTEDDGAPYKCKNS